jgi:hypothetical protein
MQHGCPHGEPFDKCLPPLNASLRAFWSWLTMMLFAAAVIDAVTGDTRMTFTWQFFVIGDEKTQPFHFYALFTHFAFPLFPS